MCGCTVPMCKSCHNTHNVYLVHNACTPVDCVQYKHCMQPHKRVDCFQYKHCMQPHKCVDAFQYKRCMPLYIRCMHWVQVLVELAAQSYRLMALAVGVLKNVTSTDLANMNQQDAEAMAGQLDLLGLLVLSNHLHPASRDTITNLQDKYMSLLDCCTKRCCDAPLRCYTLVVLRPQHWHQQLAEFCCVGTTVCLLLVCFLCSGRLVLTCQTQHSPPASHGHLG